MIIPTYKSINFKRFLSNSTTFSIRKWNERGISFEHYLCWRGWTENNFHNFKREFSFIELKVNDSRKSISLDITMIFQCEFLYQRKNYIVEDRFKIFPMNWYRISPICCWFRYLFLLLKSISIHSEQIEEVHSSDFPVLKISEILSIITDIWINTLRFGESFGYSCSWNIFVL
jgi:hypothetical protein